MQPPDVDHHRCRRFGKRPRKRLPIRNARELFCHQVARNHRKLTVI